MTRRVVTMMRVVESFQYAPATATMLKRSSAIAASGLKKIAAMPPTKITTGGPRMTGWSCAS
jgi:hypothetical protein